VGDVDPVVRLLPALLAVLAVLVTPVALWLLDQNGGTERLGRVFAGLFARWSR
jgi:hypothetical protein